MKKMILLLMLCLAMPVQAQKVVKNVELKSFRNGTMKLFVTDSTTYTLVFKTNNRFNPTFPCILGDREQAVKLLTFLRDVEIGDDDVIDLENESKNYAGRGIFGTLRIFSEGRQFSYDVTKKDFKKMLEVINCTE